MAQVRIERQTMAETEDAVAMLWRMLESYGLATPRLRIDQRGAGMVISVEFARYEDDEVMRQIECGLACTGSQQ